MRRNSGAVLVVSMMSLAIAGLAGCGGGSEEFPASTVTFDFGTGGPGSCANTAIPTNADSCKGVPAPSSCSAAADKPIESCGVLLGKPQKVNDLIRSTDTVDYAGTGDVDLSCFNPTTYPAKPGTPQTVTVAGRVKIFAAGCDSKDVTVEIHKVGADATLGELVGTPVVTTDTSESEPDQFRGKCPDSRMLRKFSYDGVPTETELIILTFGAQGKGWAKMYDYGVYIANADPALAGGVWTHDVRALAEDDFSTIPTAAMGRTITNGNGALAGEVHDCGDVRLSYGFVETDKPRATLVYMDENEENPMPALARGGLGTGKLGIYAALDIQPGPVTMSGIGIINDKLVSLGYGRARIYPNAVTLVTLRGLRPYQVP